MIEQILCPPIATAETFDDDRAAVLFPEEKSAVAGAVESRRREFSTGRACARAALSRLGKPPVPIPSGPRGAPQWPQGVTGSITHCPGYRGAAVAWTRDVVSLGLDAEPNEPLPDQGMLDIIATEPERVRLAGLAEANPRISWERLLFSAKESVYKTWFPLTGRWLDFESADIVIDPASGTFTAFLLVQGPAEGLVINGLPLDRLHGRWRADQGLLVTAIAVPA
jgi:4'-phosphopantetheinyl transferase EntD